MNLKADGYFLTGTLWKGMLKVKGKDDTYISGSLERVMRAGTTL